jgi:hypothetical protein
LFTTFNRATLNRLSRGFNPGSLQSPPATPNVSLMDLNSPIFDRIRVKARPQTEVKPAQIRCDHPGCLLPGEFRAPMGRMREGHYFCFCLNHVREYNASYNYFTGMSDDAIAKYQKDASVGHRPTWSMGVNRDGKPFREEGVDPVEDPLGLFRARARRTTEPPKPAKPRYGVAAAKALVTLGLEDGAEPEAIRTRYKELVKRLHPDANGGDRSREDKLREIIQAYKYLRSTKLA